MLFHTASSTNTWPPTNWPNIPPYIDADSGSAYFGQPGWRYNFKLSDGYFGQTPDNDTYLFTQYQFQNQLPIPPVIVINCNDHITLTMKQGSTHMGIYDNWVPLQTTFWGYAGPDGIPTYPGPTIYAPLNCPINITWENNLPRTHLFPIDRSVHCGTTGVEPCTTATGNEVRTVVHLHGSHVTDLYDGHPEAWYTNSAAEFGPKFTTTNYRYSNDQYPCTLFYHDHTLGITRLNVYAGLAGLYILEDRNNVNPYLLPSGEFDIPLVVTERTFDIRNGRAEMVYPYALKSQDSLDYPPYSMLPENFGDVMMVNGMAYPNLNVKRAQYRFRLLNNCDSRFVRLELLKSDGTLHPFRVIAGDQGYIPVVGTVTNTNSLVLGPAERYEIVVDFSTLAVGTTLTWSNMETSLIGPVTPLIDDTFMQFTVIASTTTYTIRDYSWNNPDPDQSLLDAVKIDNILFRNRTHTIPRRQVVVTEATEVTEGHGLRPFPHLASKQPTFSPFGQEYEEPPEIIQCGMEIWEIINLTGDSHPIHIHLVHFKILSRTGVTPNLEFFRHKNGLYRTNGDKNPTPPDPWEKGPKDTIVLPPRTAGRVVMYFDMIGEYMWHCHILSHEDHLMMRPFVVVHSNVC